jgi:putative oxygen-independent coproporphyrinogen III oxidase
VRSTPTRSPCSRAISPDDRVGAAGSWNDRGVTLGVYVHIPFCARACDYCDFARWTDRGHLVGAYVDACRRDLARRVASGELAAATSVFFGGGTPSLIDASELDSILAEIPRAPDAEVTVECNPDSVDLPKLAAYRSGGVTRLSFGVQSMRPHVLGALGRTHDPGNVVRAVEAARAAGFEAINVDVIYGAPAESIDDWRITLEDVLALEVPHVSAYALTVEPATALGRRVDAGAPGPSDDDQARKYELADEMLTAGGLAWYELSNWARPGARCAHNLLTWAQGDYLPVGCAAHGHRAGRRWWNVRTPERYIERVERGMDPEAGHEVLDAAARADEALALSLRTREGAEVPVAALGEARALEAAGLVRLQRGRACLTRRGRLLATDVTARLLVTVARGRDAARAAHPVGTQYH